MQRRHLDKQLNNRDILNVIVDQDNSKWMRIVTYEKKAIK